MMKGFTFLAPMFDVQGQRLRLGDKLSEAICIDIGYRSLKLNYIILCIVNCEAALR